MFKKLSIAALAAVFAIGLFLVPVSAAKGKAVKKERSAKTETSEKKKGASPEMKKLQEKLKSVKEEMKKGMEKVKELRAKERGLQVEMWTLKAKEMKERLSDGLAKIDAKIEEAKKSNNADQASKLADKKDGLKKAVSLSDEVLITLSGLKDAIEKTEKEKAKELQSTLKDQQKKLGELIKQWRGDKKEKSGEEK